MRVGDLGAHALGCFWVWAPLRAPARLDDPGQGRLPFGHLAFWLGARHLEEIGRPALGCSCAWHLWLGRSGTLELGWSWVWAPLVWAPLRLAAESLSLILAVFGFRRFRRPSAWHFDFSALEFGHLWAQRPGFKIRAWGLGGRGFGHLLLGGSGFGHLWLRLGAGRLAGLDALTFGCSCVCGAFLGLGWSWVWAPLFGHPRFGHPCAWRPAPSPLSNSEGLGTLVLGHLRFWHPGVWAPLNSEARVPKAWSVLGSLGRAAGALHLDISGFGQAPEFGHPRLVGLQGFS